MGIQPIGNALLAADGTVRRSVDLGLFCPFDDEFIVGLLTDYLDAASVARLGATSRTFYALANIPYIWKEKYTADFGAQVDVWSGSWRGTYAKASGYDGDAAAASLVSARGVYSDVAYHAFLTAAFNPKEFLEYHTARENSRLCAKRKGSNVERQSISDNIPRIHASVGIDAFQHKFAEPGQPCIITGAMDGWPCRTWTLDEMVRRWTKRMFQAEAVRMSAETYATYARSAGGGGQAGSRGLVPDTSPYYLFDAELASGEEDAAREWQVPEILSRVSGRNESDSRTRADLFSLFGELRPDYRWLIAGPARSGSGWHKDPNMTSAWNAVVVGSKYWMMLPPDTPPPGVYVTADQSEVTAPSSISEWMMDFYAETKRKHGRRELGGSGKLVECVCPAGEVMYVPSGWWHLVVNLDECVALTQNFVSTVELPRVLDFMRRTPDQISGFKDAAPPAEALFDEFASRLKEYNADLAKEALDKISLHDTAPQTEDWRERLCGGQEATFSLGVDNDELGEVPW
ncbi:hypothetical protein MCUN1_002846 [Malassezia cuniculi]|uniref:JmjC domain-containing protein n=1 Tax=Malassezia cuniculi TaxID=948313 RepID=A0AAF0EVT2_9BASI|nr:hypothetical protein MCUN1_002846 [Malassezia cuniculi]